jgi:hypothetical protein
VTRSSVICVLPKLLLLVLLLGTFGCSSATYIRAKVPDNPLDRIAQQAKENWSVERVDANTLHLRNVWRIHSLLSLGYNRSCANLFYAASESVLHIQYYFQANHLVFLFIPIYLKAEHDFYHSPTSYFSEVFEQTMNGQIDDILEWSKASEISRRDDGNRFEPFPPSGTIESRPY